MKKATKKPSSRPVKWIILWSNNTDRRDDESESVFARSYAEAEEKARQSRYRNSNRFSLRGIYRKHEKP